MNVVLTPPRWCLPQPCLPKRGSHACILALLGSWNQGILHSSRDGAIMLPIALQLPPCPATQETK
jgi:hypothetical protein